MDAAVFAWSVLAGGCRSSAWPNSRDAPLLRARLVTAQGCFPPQRTPTRHRRSNPTKPSLGCPRWASVVAPMFLALECSSRPIPPHHPILSSRRSHHWHHPDGGRPRRCRRHYGKIAMASTPTAQSMPRLPTSSSRCAGRRPGDRSCKDRESTGVCASASDEEVSRSCGNAGVQGRERSIPAIVHPVSS
jgi:hypothetical protein